MKILIFFFSIILLNSTRASDTDFDSDTEETSTLSIDITKNAQVEELLPLLLDSIQDSDDPSIKKDCLVQKKVKQRQKVDIIDKLTDTEVKYVYTLCGVQSFIFVNLPYSIFANSFYEEYRGFNVIHFEFLPIECSTFIATNIRKFPHITHLYISLNAYTQSHLLNVVKNNAIAALKGSFIKTVNLDFSLLNQNPLAFTSIMEAVAKSNATDFTISNMVTMGGGKSRHVKDIKTKLTRSFRYLAQHSRIETLMAFRSTCDSIESALSEFKHLRYARLCDLDMMQIETINEIKITATTSKAYMQVVSIVHPKAFNFEMIVHKSNMEDYHFLPLKITNLTLGDYTHIQQPSEKSSEIMLEFLMDRKPYIEALTLSRLPYLSINDWTFILPEFVNNNRVLKRLELIVVVTPDMANTFSTLGLTDLTLYATHLEEFLYYGPIDAVVLFRLQDYMLNSQSLKEVSIALEPCKGLDNINTTWTMAIKVMLLNPRIMKMNVQTSVPLIGTKEEKLRIYQIMMMQYYEIILPARNSMTLLNGHLVADILESIEQRNQTEYGGEPGRFEIFFQA